MTGTPRTTQAPFWIAVGLLLAAGVLVGPISGWANLRQTKLPLPLKKPLSALEESALYPYRVVHRNILDSIVVEALGTNEYLDWTLEDPTAAKDDPLRWVNLFITYDTGGTQLVPHTPDVCRLGAGYQPSRAHENRELKVAIGGARMDVPVRVCTFVKTAVFNRQEHTVIYTFGTNGRLAATRDAVRLIINHPANRHAYFSKVEMSFPQADREQSIIGAEKILAKVLPVLQRDHWPDFESAERSASR